MDLIIKPTGRCNFDCKFCSAANLDIAHPEKGIPDQIKEIVKFLDPKRIILTGGDPLTLDPQYFYELRELTSAHVSFTSNLKGFYLNPDMWANVIKDVDFYGGTSFNYGDTRMWNKNTIYSEGMFIEVEELYRDKLGYCPSFIAVIDEYNESMIFDHINLAKRLNTKVRLNNALKLGKQGKSFPRYKMMKYYLQLIDMGLDKYEVNCLERSEAKCSFNAEFRCSSGIRCCYIDSNNNLHYNNCEDEISLGIEFPLETIKPELCIDTPPVEDHINDNCMYCELFRFCNGCRSNVRSIKEEFPEHCEEMLKMKNRIIETGWAL